MKLPNWVKIVWWFLLVGFFVYLLSQRYNSIISGDASAIDIVIFLILIALLSIPLFREVDFFGVRLKKEIDSIRTEFKEQVFNLRSDIQNTINMRTEINPQIYLPLPKDSDLPDIKASFQKTIAKPLEENGIKKPVPEDEKQVVPENTMYLFSVRYEIENELNRIMQAFTSADATFEKYRPHTILQMIDFLKYMKLIESSSVIVLRDILAICNAATHGSEISDAKISFVRDIAPGFIKTLKLTADKLEK